MHGQLSNRSADVDDLCCCSIQLVVCELEDDKRLCLKRYIRRYMSDFDLETQYTEYGDIKTKFTTEEEWLAYMEEHGPIHLCCAGSPCNNFSGNNHQHRKKATGRSGLDGINAGTNYFENLTSL